MTPAVAKGQKTLELGRAKDVRTVKCGRKDCAHNIMARCGKRSSMTQTKCFRTEECPFYAKRAGRQTEGDTDGRR